jgi:hypothetical protein
MLRCGALLGKQELLFKQTCPRVKGRGSGPLELEVSRKQALKSTRPRRGWAG